MKTYDNHPSSWHYTPIYRDARDPENSDIVALVSTLVGWDTAYRRLLPETIRNIIVVSENTCNQTWTYEVSGPKPTFLGDGDFHDDTYDSMKVEVDLSESSNERYLSQPGHCLYKVVGTPRSFFPFLWLNSFCRLLQSIYPSREFHETYLSNSPIVFTSVIALTFVLTIVLFLLYDWWVHQRNQLIVTNAAKSNAIVTSMFPGDLRDKIMELRDKERGNDRKGTGRSPVQILRGLENRNTDAVSVLDDSEPIASLYLETTVLFADIVGFTPWSSVRAPSMVFAMLEQVFHVFDRAARRARVFKVETVGK